MVVRLAACCDYEAELREQRPTGAEWTARERLGSGPRLVGRRPRIFVDHRRITLTEVKSLGRFGRQVVLATGRALLQAARPGGRLYVSRTRCASFGISLIRREALVLAFGTLTAVPLGRTVVAERAGADGTMSNPEETWLEIEAEGERSRLRPGERVRVGGFGAYLERSWQTGEPGTDEQAAIADAEGDLVFETARSAILLANTEPVLRRFGSGEHL